MSEYSFMPQGGDGAEAIPPHGMGNLPKAEFQAANHCFRAMAISMANDEMDNAKRELASFVFKHKSEYDPFAFLTAAGILSTAWILRVIVGDPNPLGPPIGRINSMVLAQDADSHEMIDTPDIEAFAIDAVTDAANWDWQPLNKRLADKAKESDGDFFVDLSFALIHTFVGLGGVELAGWQ